MDPRASIVIPTRERPSYLQSTLASLVPDARAHQCEVLVVDDSAGGSAAAVVARAGARYLAHPRPLGANAARNTGVQGSTGELIVFLDDDVIVCEGWLHAFLTAAERHSEIDVFAGAIEARLEGRPPRSCGREDPPITTLDLGRQDVSTRFAWSANMAVRRSALLRVGLFDTSIHGQGEEQEWQERLHAHDDAEAHGGAEALGDAEALGGAQARGGAEALYVAGARLVHRRNPADSRLRALARTAYRRGKEARRFDARRGEQPSCSTELATLFGCVGHVVRYRCPSGLTMASHSLGRLREALAERARVAVRVDADAHPNFEPEPLDDFLSGESGTVGGLDSVRRELQDRATDALELLGGRRVRLARAGRTLPQRSVLALGVTREEHRALADAVVRELRSSRHHVELHTVAPEGRGKFANLNTLLQEHPAEGHDWLIVFDDDIELPRGFLDAFLFLAERFALDLAQPAHRRASHAAWQVTRRQSRSVVRETRFVEIGPLTGFARSTFSTLLPFPPLQMGWGLEAHWAAIAKDRGWRCGVIDALALNHRAAPAAQAYSRALAIAEARAFLAERAYLPAEESQLTLATHRRW